MKTSTQSIQGGIRLIFDTVEGITNAVERMHETIARHPLPWSAQPTELPGAHGFIASAGYSVIRGSSGALRKGVDRSFELLRKTPLNNPHRSEAEIRALSDVEGAFGDHLEASCQLTTP